MSIKDNIASIKQNIKEIEEKCHREDEVNLMAVTKTVDVDKVLEAIDAGITDIGVESTVIRVVDGVVHILRPRKNHTRKYTSFRNTSLYRKTNSWRI